MDGNSWRRDDTPEDDQQRLAQALVETARVINQSLKLDEVLQLILKTIGNVVPHDAANIMLVENGVAKITAVNGYEKIGVEKPILLNQRREIRSVPTLWRMAQTGEPIVISDTRQSSEWTNFASSGWILSFLSTPILHKGKTIGFINLNCSTLGFYSNYHAERLRSFADQAAIAIENARLYEKAQDELAVRKKIELELQATMNELESRVEQRTAQLKNMNEQLHRELQRRQKAERALETERTSLAKRVEERTAELSSVNAELARAAHLKDAFLANMSHELRTPLNAIINVAETLEEQVYGPLNDRQLQAVRTQEASAAHLLSLINDILDLSKIGAGKLELVLDIVPIQALCTASLKFIEEAAKKKDINLSMVIDPAVKTVWGDLRRLKQVLVNLLSNAVKFTPQGGSVGLAVAGDQANRQIHFMVWDTGIGILEQDIPNLFKPFTQLDNSLSRKYDGTGLGLALAYHIVEMHGGGIFVSSEEGKGSQFTVTLNWMEEAKDASVSWGSHHFSEADEVETYSSSGQKIQQLFSEFGIEFTSIALDDQMIEKITNISPNIIALNLPLDSDCRRLVNTFRTDGRLKSIPILIWTRLIDSQTPNDIPEGVVLLNWISSRQEFRNILKSASVTGTASLFRKAVLINYKETINDQKEPRILLVDDNELTVRPMADYLVSRGYRVVQAYNGVEAMAKAREFSPDLILMDIQMPGMDGMETIRRIRADVAIQNIPIIAVTALAMPSDRQHCLEAGANGYLSKPISLRNLIEVIRTHIGKPEKERYS